MSSENIFLRMRSWFFFFYGYGFSLKLGHSLPCVSMSIRNVPKSLNWTGGISECRNFNTTSATPANSILDLFTTGKKKKRGRLKHFFDKQNKTYSYRLHLSKGGYSSSTDIALKLLFARFNDNWTVFCVIDCNNLPIWTIWEKKCIQLASRKRRNS